MIVRTGDNAHQEPAR